MPRIVLYVNEAVVAGPRSRVCHFTKNVIGDSAEALCGAHGRQRMFTWGRRVFAYLPLCRRCREKIA